MYVRGVAGNGHPYRDQRSFTAGDGTRTPLQGLQGHAGGMKMTIAQDILAQLQPGFEDLAPLVREWALPTEQQRYNKPLSTALPDLRLF
jgi:hypothetical protein